jgi:hypothetical protein
LRIYYYILFHFSSIYVIPCRAVLFMTPHVSANGGVLQNGIRDVVIEN